MMVGWYTVLMFISLNVCTLTYSDVHTSAIQKPEPENMILGFGISLLSGLQAGMNALPVIAAAILISDFLLDIIIITIPDSD